MASFVTDPSVFYIVFALQKVKLMENHCLSSTRRCYKVNDSLCMKFHRGKPQVGGEALVFANNQSYKHCCERFVYFQIN